MTTQVSARVDPDIKRKFDSICKDIGITPSSAISVFVMSVINNRGIPFNALSSQVKSKKLSREETFARKIENFDITDDFDDPLDCFEDYM